MKRTEFVAALRQAADLLEKSSLREDAFYHGTVYLPVKEINDAREIVKSFGKTDKSYIGNDMCLKHEIGSLDVVSFFPREYVCRKITTTKTLPPEPEKVIPAQPERTIEVVEWDCGGSILDERGGS